MYRFIVLFTLVTASQSLNIEVSDKTVTLCPQKASGLTIQGSKEQVLYYTRLYNCTYYTIVGIQQLKFSMIFLLN